MLCLTIQVILGSFQGGYVRSSELGKTREADPCNCHLVSSRERDQERVFLSVHGDASWSSRMVAYWWTRRC
jgi:hypothetical protein